MAKVKRGGLGKGLDSLIPDVMTEAIGKAKEEKPAETKLKLSEIEPNREQPRKIFDEEALAELADSIRQYGVLQPLLVQKKDGYYEIIAGERRWRAAKQAGLKEVPVVIKDYTAQEIMEISLIENIQRENLNPIEEAQAYQMLLQEFNLRQEDVAKRVSKSRSAITNTMRLLKLDPRVQDLLVAQAISSGHARALLALEDGDAQAAAAQKICDEQLNVRQTEELVKVLLAPKVEKPAVKKTSADPSLETAYAETEKKLTSLLGTKVTIRRKDEEKGRIEIAYYSLEELERVIELLEQTK